jgi:hypothetical protein
MTTGAATQDEVLQGLLGELRRVTEEARAGFGALSAEQLNWKPAPEEWSVGQCLDHLIKTNESYFEMLGQVARGEKPTSAWERLSPLTSFWGTFLVKSLEPESTRKIKTTPKFFPSVSGVTEDVVERFAAHQEQLARLMEATASQDLGRVVVTSPFSRFVTYRLLDAYRGILAHERRHLAQARRVTEAEGFPRGAGTVSGAGQL